MLDIKTILEKNGITGEVVDTIADTIKQEIPKEFVSKTQYAKKVNLIDELNTTIADLEAKEGTDGYKEKYDTLVQEFDTYKGNIETEKINNVKSSTLREQLKTEGFNEKLVKLLEKNFDLKQIEVEEEKIKGWDELIKPFKEEYKDFISVKMEEGQKAPTPPAAGQGKTYTLDTIKGMTSEEIKRNYADIQRDLQK